MMFKSLLILSLLSVAFAMHLDTVWRTFKAKHGKSYAEEEENIRRNIFTENVRLISQHNLDADFGKHNFRLEINRFADWTDEEYRNYLGYRNVAKARPNATFIASPNAELPRDIDWRNGNLVVDIKDQGGCGSCWAFSAIASLEGQHAKKTGKLESLSEQQLVDCSWKEGNVGCRGGLMTSAFDYLKRSGAELEDEYPYEADDGKCRFQRKSVIQKVTGYSKISKGDEDALKEAVATIGPVSVAIDAGSIQFRFYSSGVYDQDGCGIEQEELNHGVAAVGYGQEDGEEYWLVRNSWGEDWGDEGYIKMSRNKENQCGIATDASYPLL